MFKSWYITPTLLFLQILGSSAVAQDAPDAHPPDFRVVIASPASNSISVLAVPPVTSWTGTIGLGGANDDVSKSSDIMSWLSEQNARIGLSSLSIPWHVVISYDQFDEDGDNVHSGTYEELWAGSKKFRITYKADDLNQVDYGTTQGLYRSGDQQWPNLAQEQVSKETINPLLRWQALSDRSFIK